ncbi:arginine--tRNA ligase [Streptomyces sp. RKND-216]|uniref:DALR anticodon-binding domain-containing protein n=1 Tax=Streptomyces sp. RKND-216 TaxID=2562581 RepID=UPI00109D8A07|nr:DALR anticodon-binding domain-containing protein [Streptomyces sp. RKND-216]THA24509.1 arginine--tRNA ligase [Streptomyces sp. RKND-216]
MTPAQLSSTVQHVLRGAVGDAAPGRVVVESPPRRGSGDYATGAVLQAARASGKDVRRLAGTVADTLAGESGVAGVEVQGPGFLNVTLDVEGRAALVRALTGPDHSTPDAPAQDVSRWAAATGETPEASLPRTDGSSLFRVQYAHARTRALLRNATDLGLRPEAGAGGHGYGAPAERRLLALLADQRRIVEAGDAGRLARHLTAVADACPVFHEACPPLPRGDEKPGAAHRARLALTEACGTVLAGGLSQLGVTAPAHL